MRERERKRESHSTLDCLSKIKFEIAVFTALLHTHQLHKDQNVLIDPGRASYPIEGQLRMTGPNTVRLLRCWQSSHFWEISANIDCWMEVRIHSLLLILIIAVLFESILRDIFFLKNPRRDSFARHTAYWLHYVCGRISEGQLTQSEKLWSKRGENKPWITFTEIGMFVSITKIKIRKKVQKISTFLSFWMFMQILILDYSVFHLSLIAIW